MDDLSEALTNGYTNLSAADLLKTWTENQRKELTQKLIDAWSIGSAKDGFKTISHLIMNGLYSSPYNDVELSAMILGCSGEELHLETFLEILQTPRENE